MSTGRSASATLSTDANQRFSVVGSAAFAVIAYARARELAVTPVLARLGIDESALSHPDSRLSQGVYNALVDALATRDDCFGLHLAEAAHLENFGLLGHLARHAATLGEALDKITRYSRIVHDAGRVEVEKQGGEICIHPGCRGMLHDYPRHVAENAAASVVVLAREVLGRAPPILRVTFRHPAPERTLEHQRIFGVRPCFDAPETTVVLPVQAADLPNARAEPSLAALLERYAQDLVTRLREHTDIAARTEAAVARRLEDGAPSIGIVARDMGTSRRTLQRRLSEVGTSFQDVLDSVRRRLAERYLRNAEISVQEVAFLLGFSEPKNFHRSFRRWYGTTPGEWRHAEPRR